MSEVVEEVVIPQEEKVIEQPPVQQVNPQEWFKTEFNLEPEVAKQRLSEFDRINQELEQSRKVLQEKEVAWSNTFADDFTKGLNELKKSGAPKEKIKAYIEINEQDLNQVSAKDALALRLKFENGWDVNKVNKYIETNYGLDKDEYYVIDEDGDRVLSPRYQRDLDRMELQLDKEGAEAKRFLDTYRKENLDLESIRAKQSQKIESLKSEASKHFAEYSFTGLEEYEILPAKDNLPEVKVNYKDQDFAKTSSEVARDFLIQNNLEPTTDNIQRAREHARRVFYYKNGDDLVKKVVEQVRLQTIKDMEAILENPTRVKTEAQPQGKKVQEDEFQRWINEKIGKK